MDTRTGRLISSDEFRKLGPEDAKFYVEVDATLKQVRQGRVGRNDPCPCGSGKKFKKCCLARIGEKSGLSEQANRKLLMEGSHLDAALKEQKSEGAAKLRAEVERIRHESQRTEADVLKV